MSYSLGDVVTLRVVFTVGETPTDPDTVTLTLREPTGTLTAHAVPPVVRESAGAYRYDFTPAGAGLYAYRWVGTGAAAGSEEGTFAVGASLLGDGGLPDVRARLARMVAAGEDPALDEAALDDLIAFGQRTDRDGRRPDELGWIPTYALASAAAEGWRWKAALASCRVDVSDGQMSVKRSQIVATCLTMAERYARQTAGAIGITRRDPRGIGVLPGWEPLLGPSYGPQGDGHPGPPYIAAGALPGAYTRGDNTA
jgi:hypothetical protein